MTSIPPAQPRPPPVINLPQARARSHSRTSSQPNSLAKEGVKNPLSDNVIDLVNERPAKRQKISSGSFAIPGEQSSDEGTSAPARYRSVPWSEAIRSSIEQIKENTITSTLPPLPERPWSSVLSKESSLQFARPAARIRKSTIVPNTPDCITVPSQAPLFENATRADYFPWTGKHLEDVLSEQNVKQGYCDRAPNPPDKELNTAKAPLYNALKYNHGLDTLSAFFSMLLDSKSKHGSFSSASSLKGPPPRVTLTEAKRKSWIADLANQEVPLRKLSKTIPQGIRGIVLLEQCLQNTIPLTRAIWFTKCVGANEIRTLKRKGTTQAMAQGAEAKWLRDWTINVEQFIDGVLAQCGQGPWQGQIRYCISLTTRLYLENLLDRDHYLEWIVKSLSAAAMSHWPFWLMMIHLHKLDLIAFRKRGKQTADSLLSKYGAAQSLPADILQPVASKFAAIIRALAQEKLELFLLPDRWEDCRIALNSCLDADNEMDRHILESLQTINQRASGKTSTTTSQHTSPMEEITEVLDSAHAPFPMNELHSLLRQTKADSETLMRTCLEWCVSRFRAGKQRVYLCARLFRKWQKQGEDTDKIILEFLFTATSMTGIDLSVVKHLVSELSRTRTFPLSKYMQWLSVRGLPRAQSFVPKSVLMSISPQTSALNISECAELQFLTEVSLVQMEDHLVNLRSSILSRAGFDENLEVRAFEQLRELIKTAHNRSLSKESRLAWTHVQYDQLPWTLRTQLSSWIRNETVILSKAAQIEVPGKPPLPGVRSLTLDSFLVARDVLEKLEDYAILADVLQISASSKQEEVLAAAVDTLNMHSSVFAAIGALQPLQELYGQAYLTLRSVKAAMPLYVNALIDICQQSPVKTTPVRALQQDFVRGDRGRAITACSPFSHGVAESLQQAGATFHGDFEAILQTESNMSEQTMLRLFKVLIERIEKTQSETDNKQHLFMLCQLLARLKYCHMSQGSLLVKKWVAKVLSTQGQQMSVYLLVCLLNTRCIELDIIIDLCQQLPVSSSSRRYLYECVLLTLTDQRDPSIAETLWYGFKLAVSKIAATRPVELLEIIGSDESGKSSNSPLKAFSIATVVSNPEMIKSLSKPAWIITSQALSDYLRSINSSDPPGVQARLLATSTNPLSLPYCALRMRMLCQNAATKSDENIQDEISSEFCSTADGLSNLYNSPKTLQGLLRSTGPTISAKVRNCIENNFYHSLPKFLQTKGLTQPPMPTIEETEMATAALEQVILVNTDAGTTSQPSSAGILIEKLTIYMKTLGTSLSSLTPHATTSQSPTSPSNPSFAIDHLSRFIVASLESLDLLLRMVCVKRASFGWVQSQQIPNANKTQQQEQIKLVGLVITLATHSVWSTVLSSVKDQASTQHTIHKTLEFAFDVAATLVDEMAEEARVFCTKILKDKMRDERVRWLLGSVNLFGSLQAPEAGHGYQISTETRGIICDWKPKVWEMLETGGTSDSSLGLGLFGARKI